VNATADPDRYVVPARTGSFQFAEKRSKFMAVAQGVSGVGQAEDVLKQERQTHHDAAHHCFAWRLLDSERSSDAGEPSGTAGRPILDAIHSASLHEVVVVVIRYFGGVKLGPGGLKRAYAEAARGALADAGHEERFHTCKLTVSFDHGDTSPVHHVAERFEARPVGSAYGDKVALQFELRRSHADGFRQSVIEATHGRAAVHDAEI
jgi:uncharacterized YigZ family protein